MLKCGTDSAGLSNYRITIPCQNARCGKKSYSDHSVRENSLKGILNKPCYLQYAHQLIKNLQFELHVYAFFLTRISDFRRCMVKFWNLMHLYPFNSPGSYFFQSHQKAFRPAALF